MSRTTGILLLSCMLVLGGCGPRLAGRSSTPVVRLAYFPNVTHGIALVGTANGAFARALGDRGTIQEQIFNAGPAEIEALFASQVDIGYVGPGPAINGFLKSGGKALRIVAGASSGGASLVARSDSKITDVKGLAGKRVASPQTGGTQDISLRHTLRLAGLESTDKGGSVSVLPIPNPDTLTLFQKKEIDGAWAPEPWVSRLVREGGGRVIIDERDLWPDRSFASTVVIVRTAFQKEHPDLVAAFLKAHVDAVDWVTNHPDEGRKIIGRRIKDLTQKAIPPDVLADAFLRTDFTSDPLCESVLTFADWSRALGFQREDRRALAELFDLRPLNAVLAQRGRSLITKRGI